MSDVFISHVEEDASIALEIARGLEAVGYTTWYYERDSVVGPLYLLQIGQAIEQSRAVVLIISPDSLASNQVTSEVVRAHESGKPFLPVLRDITHPQFQQRQPVWRQAVGASVAINLPPEGVTVILPRLIDGLRALGIRPKSKEEREAEAREQERAKKVAGLLTKAQEAQSAEDWDQAIALLKQALELAPDDEMVQERLREVQQQQRESQLGALKARARSLAKAEEWDEALSTWREYIALEPEDRGAAEAEIQQVERLREMVQAYAQAQAAMAKKDYDRATELLQGLITQDPAYKDAARLLAKAVELARRGEPLWQRKWLWRVLAGVAVVAVAFALTQLRHLWAPSESPVSSPVATIVAVTVSPSPSVVETAVLSLAEGTTAIKPSELTAETATPTHRPDPTPKATTSTDMPTATSVSAAEPPTAAPAASPTVSGAPASRSILVPDEVVGQFFSPSSSPDAVAVVGDVVWVADGSPQLLYQLDRSGTPLASLPVTPTGHIAGLAWDGEALLVAWSDSPDNLVMRIDPAGAVLGSYREPHASTSRLVSRSSGGTVWHYRDNPSGPNPDFVLEYSISGELLQILPVFNVPGVAAFASRHDGLWVISNSCDWYRFGVDGRLLARGDLPIGTYDCWTFEWAFDEQGYVWLLLPSEHRIYQLSLEQSDIRPQPASASEGSEEQALPRPRIERSSTSDRAIVHVFNGLHGTMSLAFGGVSVIVQQGETWSGELSEGIHAVFATANQPTPIAFSGKELLIAGYSYTWVLSHPE